jgi:hypothetical protein
MTVLQEISTNNADDDDYDSDNGKHDENSARPAYCRLMTPRLSSRPESL